MPSSFSFLLFPFRLSRSCGTPTLCETLPGGPGTGFCALPLVPVGRDPLAARLADVSGLPNSVTLCISVTAFVNVPVNVGLNPRTSSASISRCRMNLVCGHSCTWPRGSAADMKEPRTGGRWQKPGEAHQYYVALRHRYQILKTLQESLWPSLRERERESK